MPDSLQTAEARLPSAPPFLTLCPLQSQLHGYQFQRGVDPIPVLPTASWLPWELGQEFKPMRAKESWGLPTETEASLISPNVTVALILFCQTALNWGRNIRAIDKQGCIFDYDLGQFWIHTKFFLEFPPHNFKSHAYWLEWEMDPVLKYEVYLQV